MQLAAHTFGFVWQEEAEPALEAIASAGFRQVQLMAAPPHFDPWRSDAARTARLRELIARYGLELLAGDLASSDINLASASAEVTSFSVDAYKRLIARCAELGAAAVCVGSGRRHALLAKANDRLMESFRPAFREIVAEARRHGLSVGLENHPQGLLADAGTIRRFIEEEGYGDVTVIYDVANAVAIGEDPVEGLATLASHLSIVHLSDSPAGQWRHDPIGSGAIDFGAIGRELGRQDYNGPVALEILSETPMQGLLDGARKLIAGGWRFEGPLPRL
ncbi:Sugar phosphate isomerase/epimerase [Hyphomicrobiales bacterium]|nr:Sugar phosphate isomerase/epimerase [Hyphomicrobiales bacterium]CAH1699233.1 Sugar phosphate isomerase/epimerase [Hyphomicrobiales bacterium]CAI0343020.1 Sugar phosphate isomerase/epimerase [Hyphomicrobiales bacterium]